MIVFNNLFFIVATKLSLEGLILRTYEIHDMSSFYIK